MDFKLICAAIALFISAPSLGVYYFLSLAMSVCPSLRLSVTDKLQIDSSFLFLDGIEPIFGCISSPCGTLQNVVLRFWICCHGNEIWAIFAKTSNCFFFCFSLESSHFWPTVLRDPLYKTLFFDFWFRPPDAQNLLPKICTKSPITRLVWQIDRRCLGLPGGFRDGRFNGTMQNVVGPTHVGLGAKIQSPTGLCSFPVEVSELQLCTRVFMFWIQVPN